LGRSARVLKTKLGCCDAARPSRAPRWAGLGGERSVRNWNPGSSIAIVSNDLQSLSDALRQKMQGQCTLAQISPIEAERPMLM
jgi:hypothetical protein